MDRVFGREGESGPREKDRKNINELNVRGGGRNQQ